MRLIKVIMSVAASLTMVISSAQAAPVFFQGFETDTAGWLDAAGGVWEGSATRTISGTGGVTSFEGSYHAIFQQSVDNSPTGPFTRFDGYRDVFPGTYVAQNAIYLDTGWDLGEGFDYSVASNGSDGAHQRDFIFHVTMDTSTGDLLVGGSNNTNFDPREDLENINHFTVADSGWYIFEHVFRDDGGILAVDLNLRDALGGLLFTETRSSALELFRVKLVVTAMAGSPILMSGAALP